MAVTPGPRAASPAPSDRTLLGASPSAAPSSLYPHLPAFSASTARDSMDLYLPPAAPAEAECCAGGEGACWHCLCLCLCEVTLGRPADPSPVRSALRRTQMRLGQRKKVAFDATVLLGTTWSPDDYERGSALATSFPEGDSDDSDDDGGAGAPPAMQAAAQLARRASASALSAGPEPPDRPRRASSGSLSAFGWLERGDNAGKLPDLKAFWAAGRRGEPVAVPT